MVWRRPGSLLLVVVGATASGFRCSVDWGHQELHAGPAPV